MAVSFDGKVHSNPSGWNLQFCHRLPDFGLIATCFHLLFYKRPLFPKYVTTSHQSSGKAEVQYGNTDQERIIIVCQPG